MTAETKEEMNQLKKCMFTIQKNNAEMKKHMNSMFENMKDMNFTESRLPYTPVNPEHMIHHLHTMKGEDSQDDDFYMDDDLRNKALIQTAPESKRVYERAAVHVRQDSLYSDQDEMELQELTHDDLQDIVKEYMDEDVIIDENYAMVID